MKTRQGFVSNSSSSSFVVSLEKITARDAALLMKYPSDEMPERGWVDCWNINVDDKRGVIIGWTSMDNGDLSDYCKKHNINEGLFSWENF